MNSPFAHGNQTMVRVADVVSLRDYTERLNTPEFDVDSPVLLARLAATNWKLATALPDALSLAVETHKGVPFVVLRYQWGETQAVFAADAAEPLLWRCLDAWRLRGKCQLLLLEHDGMSAQTPSMPEFSQETRDMGMAGSAVDPKLLLATLGIAFHDGAFTEAAASLVPGMEVTSTEFFAIKSRRLVAGQWESARLVGEAAWLSKQVKH